MIQLCLSYTAYGIWNSRERGMGANRVVEKYGKLWGNKEYPNEGVLMFVCVLLVALRE